MSCVDLPVSAPRGSPNVRSNLNPKTMHHSLCFGFRFEIFLAPGRDGRITAIFKIFGQNLTEILLNFDLNLSNLTSFGQR